MATLNERLAAFTAGGSIFRRSDGQELDGKTADAYCFLGAIVTKQGQSGPDLIVCPYNNIPDGVLSGLANDAVIMNDNDAQGLIANNINVLYRDIHKDDEVCLCLGSGKGASLNDLCILDVDNDGYVEEMSPDAESIASVPPFRILGRFMADYSAVSSKAQYAWVKGK